MKIGITWHPLIHLRDGRRDRLLYTCDLDQVPATPGVYVFGRTHGTALDPIYIGETGNLRARIAQHFQFVPLMMAVGDGERGNRVLLVGELHTGRGIKPKKVLQRVERALIKYALAQGCVLVNDKGTKTPYDTISFDGNRGGTRLFGRSMHVEHR